MAKKKRRLRGRWFKGRYRCLKCRVTPFDRDHVILYVLGSHPTQFQAARVGLELSFADMRAFCLYGLKLCDQEQFGIPGGLAPEGEQQQGD